MAINFIQVNLNHCCETQNLLMHEMTTKYIGLAIIADPYMVPDSSTWIGDYSGKTAIHWNPELIPYPTITHSKGNGYVAVSINHLLIVSVYLRPNLDVDNILEEILELITKSHYEYTIVAGDFNARSTLWGDRIYNQRGIAVESWADQLELRFVNEGNTSTCSRPQGDSIIDLTWSTSNLIDKLLHWKVQEDYENYTDHYYITYKLSANYLLDRRLPPLFPRWSFHKMNIEQFSAAADLLAHSTNWDKVIQGPINKCIKWLENSITDLCDLSTPRQRTSTRQQVYWWSDQIFKLRQKCNKKRRILTKIKRKTRLTFSDMSEKERN